MNIGLIDVDGHNLPNFALMRSAGYHKSIGDNVSWASPSQHYDKVIASKVFTFTEDYDYSNIQTDEIDKGGTGYDIAKRLPLCVENSNKMDYSLYPEYKGSLQFFSRGCIRHCPFCLVREKEGNITSVPPVELNPNGEFIEVLDNNFFANPNWRESVNYLIDSKQPVKLHGVDVRIMDEEQAYYLNKLKHKQNIHIAWDLPKLDLSGRLKEMVKHIKPYKITCYVLIGFNSTIEEDMMRINTLMELKITPFVQQYRDYINNRKPSR